MSMQLFTLGLSRLVPLLFAASGILIAGRLAYDRLRPRHAAAARGTFALILLTGAAAMAPYVWRGGILLSAEHAFSRADWKAAVDRYASYARLRGSSQGRAGARRALALMNFGRYADAEAAFLASFPPSKQGVSPGVSPIRDYVLGRILDSRGATDMAVGAFRASLAAEPCFYPGLYQLVRTLRLEGRETEARAALESFCPTDTPQDRAQRAALAPVPAGRTLPEREFYFVQED